MPRVKIDYVVSYSSEDPDNQACNLLLWDVSKKKWLCNRGESSCSVVLQLPKAVQISSVQIGAHHSALVEVLVGRSEKPNDPFKVLVPRCIFLNPTESKRDENVERVRSFSGQQLSNETSGDRWDRVRVECSQPYNKHCKYGLSFIHIFEPEGTDQTIPATTTAPAVSTAVPNRLFNIDTNSSDDEDYKPGELFAKRTDIQSSITDKKTSTEAQIRQASLKALNTMPYIYDSSSKLTKTPINKQTSKYKDNNGDENTNRQRNSLMYTDEDDKPHSKIDKVVNRHKDEKEKEDSRKNEVKKANSSFTKTDSNEKIKKNNENKAKLDKLVFSNDTASENKLVTPKQSKTPQSKEKHNQSSSSTENRKRTHDGGKKDKNEPSLRPGLVTSSPHNLLQGVVFALSGYVNPERATIRDSALAMGATFERDWSPRCTHLICAFSNTPKLKTVRSSGSTCIAVTAEWIHQCCSRRRLMPWQWYATETKYKVTPNYDDLDTTQPVDSECDTDDEIEKVMQKQKRQRKSSSPFEQKDDDHTNDDNENKQTAKGQDELNETKNSDDSVTFVRDERIQANITVNDSDTDETDCDEKQLNASADLNMNEIKCLPEFFEGLTFLIVEPNSYDANAIDAALLKRYIKAYGGVVIEESQLEDESSVDYILCCKNVKPSVDINGGITVRADWVWRCHEKQKLCSIRKYAITS